MAATSIRKSLRRKIFVRCTALVGLALIATGTLSVFTTQSLIRQRATQDLIFLSAERSDALNQLIDRNRTITRFLAADAETVRILLGHASSHSALRSQLLSEKKLLPMVEDLLITTRDGTVIASTDTQIEGVNLAFLEHIQHGANSTYIGSVDFLGTKRTFAIASPIMSNAGELLGILLAEFPVRELYALLSGEEQVGRTGNFLLLEPNTYGSSCINPRQSVLSSKGIIASKVENGITEVRPQNASTLCTLAATGGQGILRAENAEGQMMIAAKHELQDIGLVIVTAVSEREVYAPMQLLVVLLIGTTCILLLLMTLTAIRLSRDIVLPIWRLREGLQKLNAGNFSYQETLLTGDELEMLDAEISQLSTRLSKAYSSLEERVQERTRELESGHAKDEALLESIGEGFLAVDLQGKVLATNRAAEALLQWDRSEILDHHFGALLHLRRERDGKPLGPDEHLLQRALTDRVVVNTTPSETILCERKNGDSFPISISATPFLLGMHMQGVVVMLRDISEEKMIDRMKSEFISLASHQLRTPLTSIGWYIELLQNEWTNLTTDQKEYVSQILGAHQRMVELVNSLLNVSRIELGRVKIDPKEISIADIISLPLENLKPQIERKKLKLIERIPTLTVSVDPDLVRMVLENILSNAVKYTTVNGTIELSVIADSRELQFSVHDTGLGIPRAQQGRVFEKLFRADNVLKADTQGSGIGLYIAKNTVESWGGKLWFESSEEEGTRFCFTMPRMMQKAGEDD